MTEPYGTESHDSENDHDMMHAHDEHEAPSDDEFADAEQVVSHEQGEDGMNASPEASARRSPVLPIVAAIGGVVLLGVVAWWQFGGALTASDNTDLAPPPVSLAAPPVTATTDAAMPSPAPAVPAPVETPTPVAAPSPVAVATPTAPPVSLAPAMPAPAPAMPVASPSAPTPVDQRIGTLTSRIEDLQKQLEQTNKQLEQMTNMVAASAGASPASPSTQELQARLDKIEQQIQKKPPAASQPVAVAMNDVAPQPVHHKAVSKAKKASVKKSHHAVAATPVWVLRAAVPGQAWVATSTTGHDLKALQIGDTLAGIGTITSIAQKDGAWVVQGTTGVIR